MAARFFGQFLLERGVITAEGLLQAVKLQEQKNLKLGDYAIQSGALTKEQADELNAEQRKTDRMFGELALSKGYLTQGQLDALVAKQKKEHLYLGEALVQVNALTNEVLGRELTRFKVLQNAQPQMAQVPVPEVPLGRNMAMLVDLTIKLLRRSVGLIGRVSNMTADNRRFDAAFVEAVIPFQGGFECRYGLRVSKTTAQMISQGMAGKVADSDADLADAVREFGNVVAGNACATFAAEGLDAQILPPEFAVPAPAREADAAIVQYTVDTVHAPFVVFFATQPKAS